MPHHPEEHRDDLKVRVRVGHNKWAVPARAKRDIAYRQSTATLRTKHVRANQPFTALFQQAYLGVGFTASHRHQTINAVAKTQTRSRSPREAVGLLWDKRRDQFEWSDLELSDGHGFPGPTRVAAREGDGPERNPPPRSLRGVGRVATPSAKELQQVEPGGVRNE